MSQPWLQGFTFLCSHGILSYFSHVQNKVCIEGKKTENSSLLRWKNTKEIIINLKGTRMVKDGED